MSARPWFRMYREVLNNPKIQRLPAQLFKAWINLLCTSDDDGRLPPAGDIAFLLRTDEETAARWLEHLVAARLIDQDGDDLLVHDWQSYQYSNDADPTAAERKKRQRDRAVAVTRDASRCVTRDMIVTVTRTDTDTDTDTDQNRAEKAEAREQVRAAPPEPPPAESRTSRKAAKGSRWPADAVVPDDWLAEGEAYREEARLAPIDLRSEALKFANYWASKSGGSATKLDWKRTWLNWCLTAKGSHNGQRTSGKSQLEQLADIARHGLAGAVIDG